MSRGIVPASLREAIDAYDAGLAAASPAELAGAGDAGYCLRQAALETAIAQRMAARAAASIHNGLLAGATLAQIADATGMSSTQAAACWRAWADGQRCLGQRCPGLGVSEREYQQAAAVVAAGSLPGSGPAGGRTRIGSPHP
jgi:hypothetical protein